MATLSPVAKWYLFSFVSLKSSVKSLSLYDLSKSIKGG